MEQSTSPVSTDAVALLKADHRQVEQWFGQFAESGSNEEKADLAIQICDALRMHATIEEEIFYPAFLEATGDTDMHHEAEIEHAGALNLIAEIEDSGPEDDYFASRVKVLSEMIRHHVNEEERSDGMFARAGESDMDMDELGVQMQERKESLAGEDASGDAEDEPGDDEYDEDEDDEDDSDEEESEDEVDAEDQERPADDKRRPRRAR